MTVLRRRGLHADPARNGVEALERMGSHRYEVMLLDLMMPHMSGYEVLDHLATQPPTDRPLVLVLTAGLEPRPLDTRIVIGTLHKPFDVELLVDTVIGCLGARAQAAPQDVLTPIAQQSEDTN